MFGNIAMTGLNIEVSMCALDFSQILNNATRYDWTRIEVVYFHYKKLRVEIFVAKYGNDILDFLET